jgi:hypothetical protein
MREEELLRLLEQGIAAWSGIAVPNAAGERALADLPALVAEFEALRGMLRFEDEPSAFEAAMGAEKER